MKKRMQSCIALYDIKVGRHYFKDEEIQSNGLLPVICNIISHFGKGFRKGETQYNHYFYERTLTGLCSTGWGNRILRTIV